MLKTTTINAVESTETTENAFENLTQKLKDTPTSHPGLNRLRAKLSNDGEAQIAITNYSRMHHRHNRS